MFARRKGFVSIWVGKSLTKHAFQQYAIHEGDLAVGPINEFAKDANDTWYDHDFVDAFCTGRKDQPLGLFCLTPSRRF